MLFRLQRVSFEQEASLRQCFLFLKSDSLSSESEKQVTNGNYLEQKNLDACFSFLVWSNSWLHIFGTDTGPERKKFEF